jgi:uncharacterized protein DUF4861
MRLSVPALAAGTVLAASAVFSAPPSFRVVARNGLDLARAGETIEVPLSSLPGLKAEDLARLGVADAGSSREVLSQPVDTDGDYAFDQVVFQADFGPREEKAFVLTPGQRQPPRKEDFRVYGRFVRERFDDFAWENDLVAHRMYGAALETWQKEPLTSSTVDVWLKRTPRLVVNDWYMVDDYHRDHGEGADFYSAGPSRGCGGSGIWSGSQLFVSRNFRESRVLANGPLRLIFELSYLAWDAGGRKVSEKKRVTLDAGAHLNRFESTYTAEGTGEIQWAAGIKKPAGAQLRVEREQGWMRMWEAVRDGNGNQGCAVLVDPSMVVDATESGADALIVARSPAQGPAVYHAGSTWDRGPDVKTLADWDRYLAERAQRLRSPVRVDVSPR